MKPSYCKVWLCCIGLLITSTAFAQSLKVALAGLNHDHVHGILQRYKKGEVQITGIAEADQQLAQRYRQRYQLPDNIFFPDLPSMLEKISKPDAVLAYNAIADHLAVVEACAPKGISVMVEKPLATTVKDAERMAALARQHHIHLLTNYETTWYNSNQQVYELVHQQSTIGPVRKMVVHDGHQGPKEIGCSADFLKWLTDPEKNGAGALVDFGCYGANLMTWLMQGKAPIAVTAITRQIKPDVYPKVDDDATILLEYPEATGIIEASWNWPFSIKDLEVFGKTGYLHALNANTLQAREKERDTYRTVPVKPALYTDNLGYLAAVLQGKVKPDNDLSSLSNNLIVVQILEAAKQSAREGKRIVLSAAPQAMGTTTAQNNYDVLIRNGRVIDGAGNSWFYGDVGVKDGRIAAVGRLNNAAAAKVIDAQKMVVAPGFIDVHGHIESGIFSNPTADNYIFDGVTTVVTGNCGGSAPDLQKFFGQIDSLHPSINVASLIGHNTVREEVMKRDNRTPAAEEQQKMEALVAQAMQNGAVGLSTGLIYIPGAFAKTDEVTGLARAAARYNGVYASHIRNEESKAVDAINEAINIGKEANIPVEISHFKIGGRANWGKSNITLGLIEQARKEGWDVTIDQYPYTASSTNLGVRLPDWAFAGGTDSLKARLHDPAARAQIKKEMLEQLAKYKFRNYSYCVVANYSADSSYNGKNISEINRLMGRKAKARFEAETIMDMVEKGGAQMVYHSMHEDDVRYIMKYPFCMPGADAGVPTPGKGMPHPRGYGTNARILGKYVREEKLIPLEEAIRRMTSLPAQKFQLKDRGLLREGMAADIVIFNEQEVNDKATFNQPHQYSVGFKYIFVNGQAVVENGKHTGVRSGIPLYGPGYATVLAQKAM